MEKKETRGRPAKFESEKKKLKSISFSIDAELYDQYNEIIKEKTKGAKKSGAGISLNTFIKNNLDTWLKEDIKDISENMVYYIPTEEEKEKMKVFGVDTPARQNDFIKSKIDTIIKSFYLKYREEDEEEQENTPFFYYALSIYFEMPKEVIKYFENLKELYRFNVGRSNSIEDRRAEIENDLEEVEEAYKIIMQMLDEKKEIFPQVEPLHKKIILDIIDDWDNIEQKIKLYKEKGEIELRRYLNRNRTLYFDENLLKDIELKIEKEGFKNVEKELKFQMLKDKK